MRHLAVTFNLATPGDEEEPGVPANCGRKVSLTRSVSSSAAILTARQKQQQLTANGSSQTTSSGRRPSLGTSIKVLRRAATWKIRSQERLQAKRERRERRATKTLGIVLGEC